MKHSVKRLLSMILVMAMVVSMFPVSAFASDVEGELPPAEEVIQTPVEPEVPAEPEAPVEPETPVEPEAPVEPEVPAEPETTAEPDAHEHSWSYDILDATCTEAGYTYATCEGCTEIIDEVHAALGHAWANGLCERCDAVYYDLMMAAETAVDMLAVYKTGDVADYMVLTLDQLTALTEKTEAFETLNDEEIAALETEAEVELAKAEIEAKAELLSIWAELVELKAEPEQTETPDEPVEEPVVEEPVVEEPAIDEAVAAVQAMVDAMPTSFADEEAINVFWDVTAPALDAAYEALSAEQQEQVNLDKYFAAIDAAAAALNPEFDNAGTYAEEWRIKDGALTKDDVHSKAGGGTTTVYGFKFGNNGYTTVSRFDYTKLDWTEYDGQTVTLAERYKTGGSFLNPSYDYKNEKTFTVQVFHEITVDVTNDVIPDGAGVKINGTYYPEGEKAQVDYNTTPALEGVAVAGYTISAGPTLSVSTPVKASGTVSITYNADTKYSVNVTANDANGGTITAPETIGAGEDLVFTVTLNSGNGYAYYVESVSAGTVSTNNGVVTVTVANVNADQNIEVTYGKHTLDANDGKVFLNKYYTNISTANKEEALKDLRTNVLAAAGVNSSDNLTLTSTLGLEDYNITADVIVANGDVTLHNLGGWDWVDKIVDEDRLFALELGSSSYDFTIIDNDTGVSKTVTMEIADGRQVLDITANDANIEANTEPADLMNQVKDAISIKATDPKTGVETDIAVSDDYISLGDYAWPADGQSAEFTYTVTVPETKDYVGNTASGSLKLKDTTPVALVTYLNGEESLYSQYVVVGEATPTVTAPERTGYTFMGWDANGDEAADTVAATVTEAVTYTAVWTINSYDVTWDAANGSAVTTVSVEYNGKTNAPDAPEKASTVDKVYTFSHWEDEAGNEYAAGAEVTVTDAINFTAVYTDAVRCYTITWVNGNETTYSYNVPYGTAAEDLDIPSAVKAPKLDTNGVQIETYDAGTWGTVSDVTGNATYTASFTTVPTEYTITWNAGEGKFIIGEGETAEEKTTMTTQVAYGLVPVAPATPVSNSEDYYFAAWVPTEGLMTVADLPAVTGDASYTASYTADTVYNVTFMVNGEQYGNIQPVNVTDGETAEKPADPDVRYFVFKHWSLTENGAAFDFATEPSSDLTLHAVFDAAEAEIGTKGYKTLAAAYGAAQDNDTIVLLKDATMTGKLTVAKNITIDGDNHKIIANHTAFILEPNSDCTIKNVVLDSNNKAKGVKIASGNVVFDNVAIINVKQGNDALTVNGTLTLKTYFKAESTNSLIDARSGVVNAEPGTVFDISKFSGSVSPSKCDLKGAVDVNGNPFFVAYESTGYLTQASIDTRATSFSGMTLLTDVVINKKATINNTLNLNGYDLTVNDVALTIKAWAGEGSVILTSDKASVTELEGLNVVSAKENFVVKEEDGKYILYLPMPEAEITNIIDSLSENAPSLTYALNFKVKDFENFSESYLEDLMVTYGDWYTDYVMTINGLADSEVEVTFDANGEADGYLAGQYDAWSEQWMVVPPQPVTLKNGESLFIMEKAAEMFGASGLRMTLAEIAQVVASFNCGIYFTPEFLAANPDMVVTLELRVFAEKAKHGFDKNITVVDDDFENNFVAFIEGNQTKYFNTLNAAAAAANENDTITLLKDSADNALVEKNITLALNGNEFSGTLTLGNENVVLTAPEGLKVVSGMAEYVAVFENGTYKMANDKNNNGVIDDNEIFTLKVNTVDEKDAVEVKGATALALSTVDATSYLFDSTNPTITITATPVVEVDDDVVFSTTYVKSIGGAELSFDNKFVATAEITVKNGDEIVVDFAKAGFKFNDERVMNYYAGMKNVAQKDLYDIIASDPNYADADEVTITYKARNKMTHQISLDVFRSTDSGIGATLLNYAIDLLKKQTIDGILENGNILFTMDELWMTVDVENKEPFPESVPLETAVDNFLKTHDFGELITDIAGDITNAGDVISAFFAPVYDSAMYYGAHRFGYNNTGAETLTEDIKLTYKSGAQYIEGETTVDLVDMRKTSTMSGNNVTVAYRGYTDAELVNQLIGVKINEVPDAVISCEQINDLASFEGKAVSEDAYTLTFEFKGNDEYKPIKGEYTVTITKASLSMDLPNINVPYGTAYDASPVYTMGNSYGIREEIDESLIQFIVGLDVAELDVDGDGVTGLNGKIQLILSKDLQTALDAALELAGKDPVNGIDMSLAELMDYLSILGDSTIEGVQEIFDAISGITEAADLRITLGGSYPTNTGAYLYGAVSTNPNYETAYDVAYLLIAPATVQVPLEWNYVDDNNIFSYQLLQYIDLGATTGDAELDKLVHTLFMGFDQNGELLLSWNGAELGNGAYVELAFLVEFGNTLYYAVPLVRPVVIVPSAVEVQLVGATGDHNRDLHKVFNGQNQGFSVKVFEEGEMIYSDHYQDAVNMLPEGAELKVTYLGVQTNGQTYNSTVQPIHAGAYTAIASYIYIDENGNLNELGADAGVLVIEPSESTITMSETETVLFGENYNVVDTMDIKASSVNAPAEFVTDPDFTVITASVAATNDVSENGWAGVTGNVNVDFPKWVDTLLGIEEDDVLDAGNLVAEIEKVSNSIDSVIAMLGLDANATAEVKETVLARVEETFAKINELLTQLPANTSITFKSDYAVNAVGAYAVVAVVTDSDHYPSVDAGLLVIEPELTQAYLKFDYEDANGIFTKTLLSYIDLDATAYTDETYTTVHADDAKVVDAFLTIDSEGNLVTITDESKLTNGAWLQVSYIPFEIGGHMAFSDLIARPVIIVPDVGTVELVYTDAKDTQDKFEFKFDGTGKALQVAYNGELADAEDYTIYYEGVQTNGKYYERSTTAPVHAGAYIAIADYRAVSANGDSDALGNDIAVITIDLAESSISVTGGNVVYDGEEHKATITTDGNCDKTVISGYVTVTGAVDTVGVDAFVGNVNIDFPRWIDEIIADYEFSDGITPAYMKDLLESYVDEIMAKLPVDALAYIGMSQEDVEAAAFAVFNKIITLLEKMPQDVSITFNSDVAYTAPGAYLYLGIVTDSDRVPSYDTGLLVIEKMKNNFDMLDTTVTYNGEEQFVDFVNEFNTDYFTMIVDRETNTVNLLLDPDMMYVLDKLQQLTGYNLADGVPVSSLYSQLSAEELAAAIIGMIEDVEAAAVLNPAGDLNKVLTMLKTELETLPTDGKFVVNQALPVDVGTYEIYTMAFAELYTTEFSEAVLNIVPAEVIVTAENKTKVYGDADPELTYTVEGLVEGDEINVTIAREPGENVGTYVITPAADAGKNYKITVVPNALTIKQQEITVTVEDIIIGDADGLPTFTVKDAEGNEVDEKILAELNLKYVVSKDGIVVDVVDAAQTKGVYAVTAETANANYALTVTPGTLTVKHYVAQLGEDRYENLQDAVDAAAEGAFIQLLDDAGLGLVEKSLTIIRNGHSAVVAALAGYTVEVDDAKYVVKPASTSNLPLGGMYAYIDEDNDGSYDKTVDGPLDYLQTTLYRAAKGQTVRIIKSLTGEDKVHEVIIPEGITLDIQTYSLEANYLVGLNGSYMTATTMKSNGEDGRLFIAQNNFELANDAPKFFHVNNNKEYDVLPVYDPANQCYRFALVLVNSSAADHGLTITEEKLRFVFVTDSTNTPINTLFKDGVEDNHLKVIARAVWENETGVAYQDFEYKDEFVKAIFAGGSNFYLEIKGYEALGITADNVEVYGMIVSSSEAEAEGAHHNCICDK